MADKLKALWQKVLDWWNQFTAKQKTLIIGAGSVILLTIIILVSILNQPQYVLLATANSTKEASEIKELLDSNEKYKKMATSINPYGDGHASTKISKILEDIL